MTTEADEEAHGVLNKLIITKLTLMDNQQLDLHSLGKATRDVRFSNPSAGHRILTHAPPGRPFR